MDTDLLSPLLRYFVRTSIRTSSPLTASGRMNHRPSIAHATSYGSVVNSPLSAVFRSIATVIACRMPTYQSTEMTTESRYKKLRTFAWVRTDRYRLSRPLSARYFSSYKGIGTPRRS